MASRVRLNGRGTRRPGGSRLNRFTSWLARPTPCLVLHHFATVAQAQAFLTNPDLKAAMQHGGVESAPRFEIYA